MAPQRRLQEGYQPDFDIDRKAGARGEGLVVNAIRSWEEGSVEVKTDERASTTGNLYVEFECKGRPSGILTSKADSWAFVVGGAIIVLPAAELRAVCQSTLKWVSMPRGSHPTRGYLLPIKDVAKLFPVTM